MRRYIILTLFLLSLLTACNADGNTADAPVAQSATSTAIPTAPSIARPTYTVERGMVQDLQTFLGRWQPRDQQSLFFEISGTLRRVEARRGDRVTAGQLLADFQITDLEENLTKALLDLQDAQAGLVSGVEGDAETVEEAELNLLNAELALEQARAESPWTNVASSEISLENAERSLQEAEREYREALSDPTQPADSIESAYNSLLDAQNQLRSAQISYSGSAQSFNNYRYTLIDRENDVIMARQALEQAQSGTDPQNSESVQAVRNAQLSVDQINADIARSSLYAPFDGEILEVSIQPGDSADAFETVIVLALPDPKEIIAELALSDAQNLSVGDIGVCQVFNQPETAVQCMVRLIPLNGREVDQTTRIVADFDASVPAGAQIQVEMPLETRENVLWLPPAAVQTFQNRTFVVLETPDGPRRVDVQIGLQTEDRVEIISGVNEGDVVVGP